MSDNRISWDQYFIAQAAILSTRSTCTRRHVGAILVKDHRIIASGYNGAVSGTPHCTEVGDYIVDGHCIRAVHAEQNALMQAASMGIAVEGSEVYVTDVPCVQCTKLLLQAGITKINFMRDYRNDEFAESLLKEKNVALVQVPFEAQTAEQINLAQFIKD
ncbi:MULTISPECIES: deoxycytidylate deaminase [Fructobacillus]|jgi:dCMP deaminase|uniref:dCMP deaminase n=2 Tax=Fructobacillus TaxID=559173 RepID=A0A3F3H2S2_9LACO|nr:MULTISPECIES: deaminase [Fructobacillus]CAK1225987.1 Deoxycytidylate deaminase (ComEB) [Fructobacillus cardui]KMK53108.1 tRNA-specific adenosine deaminase [Fructobacillus sp. EFB-N1]NLS37414.1 competence protein ComE [Fructobacillus tropaeoli]CAK1227163.1 Deoxycytidylate deaminase (ComEB) [Fructobacillus cardui]CAK1229811.1 Deoxycytidylate deaminase (ComEB) [Fructobacillus tropaeoli]